VSVRIVVWTAPGFSNSGEAAVSSLSRVSVLCCPARNGGRRSWLLARARRGLCMLVAAGSCAPEAPAAGLTSGRLRPLLDCSMQSRV
jgi:hypothetical protein